MPNLRPIAVLGQYSSGSTALAGVLHRLGVHMGPPYWYSSNDNATDNYYEPWDLGCQLRYWWNEPDIRENTHRDIRIACLANWLRMRQAIHSGVVGAKHPLLCLCGEDLLAAWGENTVFLRAWRPLDESIAQLKARKWFSPREEQLQRTLWQALEQFRALRPHLRIDYHHLKSEPAAVLAEIAAYTNLMPTPSRMAAAVAFIDRNGRSPSPATDVLWWLRQNVLVFARQELTRADGPFAGLARPGAPLALVHPDLYLMKVQNVRTVKEEHEKLLAQLKTGGTFTVVPQADGRLSITRIS